MKVRHRLYLSLSISGIAVAVMLSTLFFSVRQVDVAIEKSKFAEELQADGVSGLSTIALEYALDPQEATLSRWKQHAARLRQMLATKLYQGTAEESIVENLRVRTRALESTYSEIARAYAARSNDPALERLRLGSERRLAIEIVAATQNMQSDTATLSRGTFEQLRRSQRNASLILFAVVAFMGVFVVLNVDFAFRNVLNPIRALQRGMEIIGAGDLTHRTGIALKNEIGALSRAFDAMTARLAQSKADLETSASQLQEAVRELESFSYSVSHDLRAPLRGIDGWSQALLEDCGAQLDAQGLRYLDGVRAEARRMHHLIEDLLELSWVARGELKRGPVDLSALARTIANRLKLEHQGRQIEFSIEPGLVASADSRLLEIVLTNLLANACKYTGTRALARIELGSLAQQGEQAAGARNAFFVRDNGVGFDMAQAAKLFGAFQRLHAAREFPGTGIGLAIVRRIVSRHGGHVWAEAQIDRGASFYFTLQ